MRKLIALFAYIFLCCHAGKAQYVNIPDSNFRNYLQQLYPTCFNGAGQIDTTCSLIVNETRLECSTLPPGIPDYTDLSALQYFKNLRFLDCSANYADCSAIHFAETLDTLIVSYNYSGPAILPPALKFLSCWSSYNTSLPPLPATLLNLGCGENHLTSLPPLPGSLQYLSCGANGLSSLPALPSSLIEIVCDQNGLTSLPALPSSLQRLSCWLNQLTSLPALPSTVNYLEASDNQLLSLPALPTSLNQLFIRGNRLSQLPSLPPGITQIVCHNNSLTSLPALPESLSYLKCSFNQLASLPELPPNIYVECEFNNIFCLPKLPPNVSLRIDADKIQCTPNMPPGTIITRIIDLNYNQLTTPLSLCNPTNNTNQCQSYPVMSGTVFFDNNNNGARDINEPLKQNGRVTLNGGAGYTFTNSNGYFEIAAEDTGQSNITIVPPVFFDILPPGKTYAFTNYDTIVTSDFALQANIIKDSLSIKLTPTNWAARPGFSFPYVISFENAGTTILSPNIVFSYDDTKLDYDSSSNTAIINNGNNLSLSVGSFVPGQQGSFTAYFKLKTTVALGDSLLSKAMASASSYQAADSNITIVRGAFDPNDKQATPQLSPSQVAYGDYIDYTIRFQNTGTDTAFTVVISDTLSDDLQTNTLQMIASSHTCKATVKDNIVFFEFLNILLPDSNVNEPKSHGFVSFKIKPKTTVPVNTTITNKAAIYFDYNVPVITNTAGTLIKDFTVVPLKLVSFSAVPQNDNTTALYWNTANEINTKQFVIERGSDGLRFSSVSTVFAKGKANNNYNTTVADASTGIVFYRLKMVDNDGSFTYSPIIKIDKRKNAAGFSLLSNPVKDFLVISTTDRALNNTQASIINMQGAVVKIFIVKEGSQTVEIKDLPTGIYYIKAMGGSQKILVR
ncbi:MAG: T9SS type A sorting domain-containing protein [Bacteroidota bacterium]